MKWAKLLRRIAAFFLATLAVWALCVTGGAEAAERLLRTSAPASAIVTGGALTGAGTRTFWEKLLLSQSPFLRVGQALAAPDPPPASQPPAETLQPEPTPVMTPEPAAPSEDDTPLPVYTPEAQKVIAQTLLPASDGSYTSADGVFLYNRTSQTVDMEALAEAPVVLTGSGKGPSILIIHTHATESYTQTAKDVYEESDPYRTTDCAHNMVRVGDEMAAAFAQAGLNVLHDRTLYDYPSYNGAYSRSRAAIEEYLALYPSISIVLDVHRDALIAEDGTVYKVMADGAVRQDTAQVMLVVGTQEGGGSHPNWRQNLTLAIALERVLNEKVPTLARPVALRKSHYNQDLSPGSLLVEVGGHGNTLREAEAAAREFAQTAAPLIAQLLP